MTIIQIGIIVLATIWSVHFVYKSAYKKGIESGVNAGRHQVLEEELIKSKFKQRNSVDLELLIDAEDTIRQHQIQ